MPNDVQIIDRASDLEISITPVILSLVGTNMKDKYTNLMANASQEAALSLINEKGELGKQARERAAKGGLVDIVDRVAQGQYRPLIEWLVAKTGGAFIIRNRAAYETLPDKLEEMILTLSGKIGKDGQITATAVKQMEKLSGVKTELEIIMAKAREKFEQRQAERAERARELEAEAIAA